MKTSLLVLLTLLAGAAIPAYASEPSAMPDLLEIPALPWPTWVQADTLTSALASSEEETAERLHPATRRVLRELAARDVEPGRCIEVGTAFVNYIGARNPANLESAVKGAEFVVHGRITGSSQGFKADTPGTLLRLEAITVLRGKPTDVEFFFFIPIGDFMFAGHRICKSDSRYVGLPQAGDEVITFSGPPLQTATGDLYLQIKGPPDILLIRNQDVFYPSWYLRENIDHAPDLPQSAPALLDHLTASAPTDN